MDYRHSTLTWDDALKSERLVGSVVCRLIDGVDVFISKKGEAFIYNGYGMSMLQPGCPSDLPLFIAISESKKRNILRPGWNIATGPGIISRTTSLENPYDFSIPLLIHSRSFPVALESNSYEEAVDWCIQHSAAGLVFFFENCHWLMFSENFHEHVGIMD